MTPNSRSFFYRIPLLNYLFLYFKIYLNNKRVKASFSSESSSKSFVFGGLATICLIFLFFWVGYKILKPSKINKASAPQSQGAKKIKPFVTASKRTENRPKKLDPSPRVSQGLKIDKIKSKETKPLSMVNAKKDKNSKALDQNPILPQDLQVEKKALKQIKPVFIAKKEGEKELKILDQNPKLSQGLEIVSKEPEKIKSLSGATPKITKDKAPLYKMVVVNLANIREKPDKNSDIVARIGKGYMFKKLEEVGDWISAELGEDLRGWIRYDLLEDATIEGYQSWKNNPNKASTLVLIQRSLEDQQKIESAKKKIKKIIHEWKLAWEKKDLAKYMSFYSKAFTKSKYNWDSYKEYKKNVFNAAGRISVEINNEKIEWNNYFLIASFNQEYSSRSMHSNRIKNLHFQLEKEGWKIAKEYVVNTKQ